MNNKSLMVATAFAIAALVFLIWSNGARSAAEIRAEDDVNAWKRSTAPMRTFAALVGHPALKSRTAAKSGATDVPATVGEIVPEVGLQTEQVRIDVTSAGTNEQAAYRIRIQNVSVAVMGKLLDRLRRQHGHLASREITMSAPPRDPVPGLFNWSMIVGVPKTARTSSSRK